MNQTLPVLVLSAKVITANNASWRNYDVSVEQAAELLREYGLESHVGHAGTANAMSKALGLDIPMVRTQAVQQPNQLALIFSLNGRLGEGQILSYEEIVAMGFDLQILERIS